MAYQVKYTNRANDSLIDILEYIEERWGEERAADVLLKVYKVEELIATFPTMGKLEIPAKGIRGFVIQKNLKVFYTIEEEILTVTLLVFFDTKQDLGRLKF